MGDLAPIGNLADNRTNPVANSALVELFDPPMCCPTGLCGPTLDQTLLNVSEMILALTAKGVSVARYQMTSQPQAFLKDAEVVRLIHERQMAALPITLVKGKVIKVGEYPALAEVWQALQEVDEAK